MFTLAEIARQVQNGEISAESTVQQSLDRIAAAQGLNAYLSALPDFALETARDLDRRRAAGEKLGPLAGVPVALKDNIVVAAGKTTCASRMLENFQSPYHATVVERLGDQKGEEWLKGLVANQARAPKGGDTDQIRGVASGECGVAIANSYYLARILKSDKPEDKAVAEKVKVVFPNQATSGTHVNIAGAAVARHAKNRDNAIAFMEYLASPSAQQYFADGNNEFSLLRTREADLEKHLTSTKAVETPGDVAFEKAREEAREKAEDDARKGITPPRLPEYGTDKDFPLAQAINQLKGRPVMVSKTQVFESKLEKKDN